MRGKNTPDTAHRKEEKRLFTVYRVIRIDGRFDTGKTDDVTEAVEAAVRKTIDDALSHRHTIENGIEITDITDCGEPV